MSSHPTVAVTGTGLPAQRLRARIRRSAVRINIVSDALRAGVAVHERSAPAGSYLDLMSADRDGEVFLDDPRAVDYVASMLEHLAVVGAHSLTVRKPIENEWAAIGTPRRRRSRLRRFRPDDYEWVGAESIEDDVVDGMAVLSVDGDELSARVRVTGHLDPLDGRYHWAGVVFGDEVRRWKNNRVTTVAVAMDGGEPVGARLAEVTPAGTVRIVGVGAPPYALDALVV